MAAAARFPATVAVSVTWRISRSPARRGASAGGWRDFSRPPATGNGSSSRDPARSPDLPGADGPTLLASFGTLLETFPDETVVHPGHMGLTTFGAERATNPFLGSLTG